VDQPDLDRRAVTPRRVLTRLLHFFALGALLVAGKRVVVPSTAELPVLVVDVDAGADADAVHRAVVDAVLIDEAVRARWPLADPVVRERRHDVARAGGAEAGADPALARQLSTIDPVTRARLAWIGRELVRARMAPRRATDRELAAYRAAHPERYAPGWLAFRQRVITTARHGEQAEADARALAARLDGADADAPGGDPTLLPARVAASPASVDARFGAGFAALVAAAPIGRWWGPIPGAFGLHVIWREIGDAPPDPLDARVERDWAHDRHRDQLRAAIDALIRQRRVVVREVPR
jgi:hypothetical protein